MHCTLSKANSHTTKATTKTLISGETNPSHMDRVRSFLTELGASEPSLPNGPDHPKDFYSDLVRCLLKVDSISRGKVSCSFPVVPAVVNGYNGLNGGVVAEACARTVVAEDKHLFTGEVSLSFLSAASLNAELMVEASLLRGGRNLTVVSIEFRIKNSRKLVYTSHATSFTFLMHQNFKPT